MKFLFTKHAKEMLIQRRIPKAKVLECLNNPDKILDSKESKHIFIKDLGNNFLKVVVAKESETFIVITLYWFAKKRPKK